MASEYEYALALTSQFYFCSLPLRLDTYSHCTFGCTYCFASARGGDRSGQFSVINDEKFERRLFRVLRQGEVNSVLDEFVARRVPIHMGGMTDPFSSLERRSGASLRVLEILASNQYPTVISTKSDLFASKPYVDVLSDGQFVVQCSMSSTDDELLADIDCGTPGPSRLTHAAAVATDSGIPVAFRVQPLLPGREEDACDVIEMASKVGAFHVGVEHLKLPLERGWWGTRALSERLEIDLEKYFKDRRSERVGREWILPTHERLPRILELRRMVRERHMTFGAADTDLLPIGDGACCCSGIDLLPGWSGQHFKHNYAEAIRRTDSEGRIRYSSIEDEWIPRGPISRWVNSRSRIPADPSTGAGASMSAYIARNWRGSPNGPMPEAFAGVTRAEVTDEGKRTIYQLSPAFLELVNDAVRRGRGNHQG